MGGGKPSAPTVIMPAETKPQQFQSVIPEKSFKDLAEQMGRIETETGKIQQQRYDEVGTPAEMGARSKGTNFKADVLRLNAVHRQDLHVERQQIAAAAANQADPGAAAKSSADCARVARAFPDDLQC